jgi:predicted nucleotidyltransferase
MGLSKRHIEYNFADTPFSCEELATRLEEEVKEISFAYLLGSAAENCLVKALSDIDIAVWLMEPYSFELYQTISRIVGSVLGEMVRLDLGVLNNAEPIFRFEALQGRLLFHRDEETWLRFYSLTCREYEHQMFDYEKQRRYRIEAGRIS